MRRSMLCLAIMLLVAGVTYRFTLDDDRADRVVAQDAQREVTPTSAEPALDPLVVPRAAEVVERVDILTTLVEEKAAPYPVFNISDVIEHLTKVGGRMYKAGETRTDIQLREGLSRKTVELNLPEAIGDSISDRDLYRRACDSVFVVCSLYKDDHGTWDTALATAFVVTTDGVLSTSCHVFDNEDEADAVVVMDVRKNVYAVRELLAANKQADTCLFRIDARNLKPLPLADDAAPGTAVRVLGHPGDSFYFLSSGLVANYERDHDGITWLNVTADFGQGSSGGPVLDERGHVVGQVSRTFTLYAGGSATRGRPRRVANDKPSAERDAEGKAKPKPEDDIADPQLVFKSCVPVKTLRALVKDKRPESE